MNTETALIRSSVQFRYPEAAVLILKSELKDVADCSNAERTAVKNLIKLL